MQDVLHVHTGSLENFKVTNRYLASYTFFNESVS